jgi:hypothetical protein
MERNTPVRYWRPPNFGTTLSGILEDLKRGDVFQLETESVSSDSRLTAIMDADIKETEVFVPCEEHPLTPLFGEPQYDSEGHLIFQTLEVESGKWGLEIRFAAKGLGFGGVGLFFSEKGLRTDTECLDAATLTAIFRAAAPALAKLALDSDPQQGKRS